MQPLPSLECISVGSATLLDAPPFHMTPSYSRLEFRRVVLDQLFARPSRSDAAVEPNAPGTDRPFDMPVLQASAQSNAAKRNPHTIHAPLVPLPCELASSGNTAGTGTCKTGARTGAFNDARECTSHMQRRSVMTILTMGHLPSEDQARHIRRCCRRLCGAAASCAARYCHHTRCSQ